MIRLRLLGPLDATGSDGAELHAVLAQPKRLTLLAYLAVEPGVFRRRETLLALFWPEADEPTARLALRQALHHLRRALGPDVLVARAADEVGVADGALWCDVAAFEAACRAGDHGGALALYGGEFLDGVHAAGAGPELEDWVAATRAQLRADAMRAARAEAARIAPADAREAAECLRRAEPLDPFDEGLVRERVQLLVHAGDSRAALQAADAFAARLRRDFGAEPGADLRTVVADLRAALAAVASTSPTPSAPVVPGITSTEATGVPPVRADPRTAPEARLADPISEPPRAAAQTTAQRDTPPYPVRRTATVRRRPVRWWQAALMVGALVVGGLSLRRAASARSAAPDGGAIAPAARGLYDAGVRALHERDDAAAAVPFFEAALAADSTCAPCAYQAVIARSFRDGRVEPSPEMTAAERLAVDAAPVDRLRIRYWLSVYRNLPARVAIAESLLALRPDDPSAEAAVGESLVHAGGYASALPHLRRVLALDSLGLRRGGPLCTACNAEQDLVQDYVFMDSLPAAEREAETWVHQQPQAAAWGALAETFEREGRFDAARAAHARRVALQGGHADDRYDRAVVAIRSGASGEAEAVLRPMLDDDSPATRAMALWYLGIVRRDQGRLREALDLARQYAAVPAVQDRPGVLGDAGIPEAQVLFELGRWPEAAARWRALARVDTAYARALPGEAARRRTWMLTQLATTLAAARDTGPLAALADTIANDGARSAYGRDHVLHYYVRGLVAEAAGHAPVAEAAFRRAILSPTEGYTRVNVALARVLLAQGRAADVPAILRPALGGSVEASNYYVTRTELHEWLARAFDALGQRDSAAAHWARVADAWREADPPLRARAAVARARGASVTRSALRVSVP